MKEDKENARPKDRRMELNCEDGEKTERSKEKKEAMTKIVIRRLPPSLTKEELEEQLQPLPEMDYLEFFSSDTSLFPHLFARAYINFKHQEDIVLFRDRFDGYVFIDSRGQEYTAVVEFAPFQKTAKKRSKKKDAKCGTIDEDPDYNKFLEIYNGDDDKMASTPETLLEEIEAKSKELVAKKTTPLLDFLKNKQRIREEKKEERRRRELERKRVRDEERRKWREEERRKRKDTDKMKRLDKPLEKDKDQVKEEPKIKLLKKPDRAEDADSEKPKEKTKKPERPNKEDRPMGGADHKRRQHIDNKEDRGRKGEEDGRKEFRERDPDRDRERDGEREKERRQREKERLRRQDEDRRRRRERENTFRKEKRQDEAKKDKERAFEKKKGDHTGESSRSERSERPAKDHKKEESLKRDRLRNKDRPTIQLYQPGSRTRTRGGAESSSADRKPDTETEKVADKGDD
ncbi:regulator of nonsense transcripts 3B isoform X1 [Notothenia coriiceps]|uniref:Regulator of nonsense transcripts 3B isoform X1 n=2 Tax=Notothenia coriiceps TaxID=8208 RepID=A0A6I9PYV5_9TELE|nr:PREDICTED: regulator of nonsense transcripts 3B isoform X1 [Notothenia coriiceps]